MDHVQDDLLAIRSELAGNMQKDFVVLLDIPPEGRGRDPKADGQAKTGHDSELKFWRHWS